MLMHDARGSQHTIQLRNADSVAHGMICNGSAKKCRSSNGKYATVSVWQSLQRGIHT
jgi:hypothetical protein